MAVYIVFDVETPNRANDRTSAIGISAIKDNASSVFTADGLERFCYGMQHLGHMQMASMAHAVSHHNFVSAALTPIKSGAI